MGRPLYSTLLTTRRATEQAATQSPPPPANTAVQTECPMIEKWSRWNSFDPDSDEFFQAEDAVYEAFLTEEEIRVRDEGQERGRRFMDRLLRLDGTSEGRPHTATGVWSDGDANLVASPRPMSVVIDGTETSPENQPTASLDGGAQATPDVRTGIPVATQISTLASLAAEYSQPVIPALPSSRNISPIPNTPARISGFFSPTRRTYITRHMISSPEPLTS